MDVAQLKTLIHVAELGSLTKAADRLRIAQPALSRQIRLLEQELGKPLFERHGRGMVPTEVGREVLEHASRILDEFEAIRNSASEEGSSFRGTVTIGTTPTVAEIVTVPLMRGIKPLHPELHLSFVSAFSGHLLDWMQRGEIDLAVAYDSQPLRSLRTSPIMVEDLLLVGPRSKRLRLKKPVPFASLAETPLILPSRRNALRVAVEDCASSVKIQLQTSVEVDNFGAMVDLVKNGFGLTILPLAAIHSHVKSGELCAAPLINPTPTRTLVLAYPADRPVRPAARFIGDTFRRITSELVNSKIWVGKVIDPGCSLAAGEKAKK